MARPRLRAVSLERAEPVRLADHAHKVIREAIIDGRFEMGAHLAEPVLAKTLGMSRAPVREALRRLSEEGLVLEKPNHGCVVCTIGAGEIINIYNVRLALETAAIRLFILNKSSTRVLSDLIAEMEGDAEKKRDKAIVRHELQFHEALIEGSRNPHLIQAFARLSGQVLIALALDSSTFDKLEAIADEHRPVLAAIEAGDPDLAARAIQDHIISTVGSIIRKLGGDTVGLLQKI